MYFVFVLGPAGSGKSYLTYSLANWLIERRMEVGIVNLDPAVSWLPYAPDVDIRDYITVDEVIRKYNLGPNGALIAAIDLSINFVENLRNEVDELKANYVIVDTPGQMELFAFRSAGPAIMSSLALSDKSVALFLIESTILTKPSTFLSLIMLALAASIAHKLPQIITITKTDLLPKERHDEVIRWIEDPMEIFKDIRREDAVFVTQYSDVITAFEDIMARLSIGGFVATSSITGQGMDELYALIQQVLIGGEDFYTEEPSEIL
ncbi:MAG: ATP/GTP-binding protein [Ignisphaera sp.]|nr:ATP/GTP-binding protein [Ignisphaera sp.]MCX8167948.1 ATP/GTP-binding protein [Ignisphaera sp.]MDW8085545.1 ATP/GTP-binding protein [Ignisphaera sp.]